MECLLEESINIDIDENNDIYPCNNYKCNKYHKVYDIDRYIFAIKYLKLDRLKILLGELSNIEVYNLKLTEYSDNILNYVISHLFGYCCGKIKPNIDCVNIANINSNEISSLLVVKLVNYLCQNYPKMITNKMVESVQHHGDGNKLLTILRNNQIDDEKDSENCCIICFSSNKVKLINNTCVCKNKIHLDCLIKLFRTNGNICKTCNKSNGGVYTYNNYVLFPSANIYKQPLLNNYVILSNSDKNDILHLAIAYLQIDRVRELLNNMTNIEFRDYIKNADYNALHILKNNNILGLLSYPYTNISRVDNPIKFREIEKLLEIKSKQLHNSNNFT